MIVIIGASASGKTTLADGFVRRNPQYQKVVTYTTRPRRPSESDGKDYHFISEHEFNHMAIKGEFVEHTTYRGWQYGIKKSDCHDNSVIVATPSGLRELKKEFSNVFSVYLYVERAYRLIKSLERGDDVDEAYRRSLSDVGMFDGVEHEVNFIINNNGFYRSIIQIIESLEDCVAFIGKEI